MTKRAQYVLVRVVADDEQVEAPMDWDWSQVLSGPGARIYAEAWGVSDWIDLSDGLGDNPLDEPERYMPGVWANEAMGVEYLVETLCALPSYVPVQFVRSTGKVCSGVTRDFPKPGRRCTVEGSEWFVTPDLFVNLDIAEVRIGGMNLQVVH